MPLCRDHHQQLRQAGNEVAWWRDLDIKPLEIAKKLWVESRANTSPSGDQTTQQQVATNPAEAASGEDAIKLTNEPN